MDTRQLLDEFQSTWHTMKQAMDDIKQTNTVAIRQMNARLDQIETKLARPPLEFKTSPGYDPTEPPNPDGRLFFKMVASGGPQGLRSAAERRDAEALLRDIESKAATSETKALSLGDDTTGGFLAQPDFVNEVIKGVQLISPLRSLARVRPTIARNVQVPTRSGVFSASWVGEVATRAETDNLRFSMEDIPVNEMYALVICSLQDLEDTALDLAAEIASEAAEQFSKTEGTAFVNGTGIKQPEGFMVNSAIAHDAMGTGGGSALTADGIIGFVYNLKSDYARNATLVMNRKTVGAVRLLKSSTSGEYIWQPNYQAGSPPTILGIPYVEMPDMPDVGAGTFPIAIGDFRRGYMIVDRVDMSVQRLNELYATSGQVGFLIRKRVGGQVVLPEAIRRLEVATS